MRQTVVVKISDEDMLAGHIPEDTWKLSRKYDVFYKDMKTGELVQILDLMEDEGDSNQIIIKSSQA